MITRKRRKLPRRVAVTGLGVITSIGRGREDFADALMEGRTGFGDITLFDAQKFRVSRAFEIRDPLNIDSRLSARDRKRMTRCDRLGLWATFDALQDAGYSDGLPNPERAGVVMGAGAGGMLKAEWYFMPVLSGEIVPERPSALVSMLPNATADWIAATLGARGPKACISTACSSSATAIGVAADFIRNGQADLMIAGGAEALCRVTLAGFNCLRAVDPEGCRPFDVHRAGMGLGEGAAILILEPLDEVQAAGRPVLAELAGYGTAADGFHMTNPHPEGAGAVRAIQAALKDACVGPDDIDVVNAHGTGTQANDAAEAMAIRTVTGDHAGNVSVSSTKSMVGHTLGAAGAIEAAASVMTIVRQSVPPTVGLTDLDPACGELDMVRDGAREKNVDVVVSNSFAFGGNNCAVVFRQVNGS